MSLKRFILLHLITVLIVGCHVRERSIVVGWDYSDQKKGGFQKVPYLDQECPPQMALIESNTWYAKEDSMYAMKSVKKILISEHEETNGEYLVYLNFLKKYYSENTYQAALPDTAAWLKESSLDNHQKTMFHYYYLRHPAYENFPVVGLNEEQINKYAIWKTDRINEYILIREEAWNKEHLIEDSSDVFTTEYYFENAYYPSNDDSTQQLVDLEPSRKYRGCRLNLSNRIVRTEDGILLPHFRLPSKLEMEWVVLCSNEKKSKMIHQPKEIKIKEKLLSATPYPVSERYKDPAREEFLNGCILSSAYYSSTKGIRHLTDNVNEVIIDTAFIEFTDNPNNEQYVSICFSDGPTYMEIVDSPELINSSSIQLKGFRLAMDYMGDIHK